MNESDRADDIGSGPNFRMPWCCFLCHNGTVSCATMNVNVNPISKVRSNFLYLNTEPSG